MGGGARPGARGGAVESMPQFRFGRVTRKFGKTITVRIGTRVKHPKLKVVYTAFKNLKVHDPDCKAVLGDWVKARHCQRISKTKHFMLESIEKPMPRMEDVLKQPNFGIEKWKPLRREDVDMTEEEIREIREENPFHEFH